MNLFLWSDDIHEDMMPVLENIKEMGFDGAEVPVFDLDIDKWQTWAKRLDGLGLERTAVTVCNAEANLISQDPEIRSRGIDMLKQTLDCCQALGAYSLNGPLHSGLGIFSGKGPTEQEWEWAVESLKKVSEHAGHCGVKLGIEFLNRFETYFLNCAADAVKFVEAVDHPYCCLMYDTFHAHIEEKNVAESIIHSLKLYTNALRWESVGYLYKASPTVLFFSIKTALNQIEGVLVHNLLYI